MTPGTADLEGRFREIIFGNTPLSFSFAGCGFNGLYHVGVVACFKEYLPWTPITKVYGSSAGALAAMSLTQPITSGVCASDLLAVAMKARSRALGPFHPTFNVNDIIFDGLSAVLPEDAHIRASGRLFINLTRCSDMKKVTVSQYQSKDDLIRAIQCSCFIPLWSGQVFPKFHGVSYMDGGMSDNLPRLDENTITVSPFAGEADICPQDDVISPFQLSIANTSFLFTYQNVSRLFRILFPAPPEQLSEICQQGFDDALRFLQRNNQIACIRCLSVYTSFFLEDDKEEKDSDYQSQLSEGSVREDLRNHSIINCTDCPDCQERRQIASLDSLPESVAQAIQEACDRVNKGLINWIMKFKIMKLMSFLSLPYVLPIDITIAVLRKVWRNLPAVKAQLKQSLFDLIRFLTTLLSKMESKRHLYSAKFSCQLAVTEYDYSVEESEPKVSVETAPARNPSVKVPKRKLTPTANVEEPIPVLKKSVEKPNSLNGGSPGLKRRSQVSFKEPVISNQRDELIRKAKQRLEHLQNESKDRLRQRKSYAGSHDLMHSRSIESEIDRRRSMIDISPKVIAPQRISSTVNIGISFDLKSKSNEDISVIEDPLDTSAIKESGEQPQEMLETLKNLEEMNSEEAIVIAEKALAWEKECLEKYKEFGDIDSESPDGTKINRLLDMAKNQDALMSFYYTGADNRIRLTEIYHFSDDESEEIEEKLKSEPSEAVSEQQQIDNEEDGLRPLPLLKSSLKSKISPLSVPPNERRRKKSVLFTPESFVETGQCSSDQ